MLESCIVALARASAHRIHSFRGDYNEMVLRYLETFVLSRRNEKHIAWQRQTLFLPSVLIPWWIANPYLYNMHRNNLSTFCSQILTLSNHRIIDAVYQSSNINNQFQCIFLFYKSEFRSTANKIYKRTFVILALEGQTLQETLRYISRKVVLIQGRIK